MKIYTPEDCAPMCEYGNYHYHSDKRMIFTNPRKTIRLILSDFAGHVYQHNMERIKEKCTIIFDKFPLFYSIIENIELYFPPYPSSGFQNATCWGVEKQIVFYGRGTQIPHCITDYIIAHELGHIIQYNFVGSHNYDELWVEYLHLRKAPRGIFDCYVGYDNEKKEGRYENREDFEAFHNHNQPWHLLPSEWFAEDFRRLYGVDTGEPFWGFDIPEPDEKVKEFFEKVLSEGKQL